MGVEIEHKYLVKDDSYKKASRESYHICQGYLSKDPERVVRVRTLGNKGFITVKSKNHGDRRLEFEYEIPYADAVEILSLCMSPTIEKTRYIVDYEGFTWEIDEFVNPCEMTTAEIELPDSGTIYSIPPFIGENVTGNTAYYNSNL